MPHLMNRYSHHIGLAILFSFLLTGVSYAQVFVYRGKIDDSLTEGIGRRYKEVQVGDFNEDGWPDLYTAQKQCKANTSNCGSTTGPNKDRVYINQGTGDFSNLTTLFSSQSQTMTFYNIQTNRGYDVEVQDFDGDGHADVARPDVGRLDILWGDGTGRFTATNIFSPKNDPNGTGNGNYDDVAILDIDVDGDFDILVAQYFTGFNLLLRNQEKQGIPRTFVVETFGSADFTHTISVEDFNSDGIFDIAVARPNGNSELLSGAPPACNPFHSRDRFLSLPDSFNPTTVADFVDLDADGLLDIYVARGVFNDPVPPMERQHYVYFQTSPGSFSPLGVSLGMGDPSVYDARYADVDLDGNLEIIRANIHTTGQGSTLQAVRVNSNRTFTDVSPGFFAGIWRGEMGVELADLDRDGDLDLVLAGSTDNSGDLGAGDAALHIYENTTITLPAGANRPPTAQPDFVIAVKNIGATVPLGAVLGNDSDPDGGGLWFTYDLVTEMGGTNDTGHIGGFNYTPPAGFVGIDRMSYVLQDTPDNSGKQATGTLTFIVTDPNCGKLTTDL